jgi:hypothetical protein
MSKYPKAPEGSTKLVKFIYWINGILARFLFIILGLLLIDKIFNISILNDIVMILIACFIIGRLLYVFHPKFKELPLPPDLIIDYDNKDNNKDV